ncbi:MAG TPA: NADH-quinone oxidoreductase subunit M [Pseudomonadales bacterium]|nr:NADH-quinone oxidoreductase subunit M [Pseudomonadales bacterium]
MILVWLILIPLIGGLLAWRAERISSAAPRLIALVSMGIALALSLWLWATQDFSFTGAGFSAVAGAPHWTMEFRAAWIPSIGASFHLGLDGLSLLMVVLTNLLGVMAVACSWRDIDRRSGFFHLNLLVNLAGVVGVFLALDLLLFFFFWETMLVPMYLMIAMWGYDAPGGRSRSYAAMKFFIYTQASGLLMLIAIVALAFVHYDATGVVSFDYHDLLGTPMASSVEWLLMLGFFIAFAVKMPMVPLHGWLPDAHTNAPIGGSVDLAGILLKTAAYGLLRFGIPLFPHASQEIAPLAMWLGVAGVAYGAVIAFAQTDLKRLVAYTSVSHMGFVVIGIYAGTQQALYGVVVQMIAHGLSAGALFILCGEIQERLQTRDLRDMGGLWTRLPNLPPILLFFALATLGLPGLGNFVGEFLILSGTFVVAPVIAIVASSGLIFAVAYALIVVQRALHGPMHGAVANTALGFVDLSRRELSMMVVLIALLLGLGLYPQPVIDAARAPVQAFDTHATHVDAVRADSAPDTGDVTTGGPR